jgi:hypothetical protein
MEMDEQSHATDNHIHRSTHSGPEGPPDGGRIEQIKRDHTDAAIKFFPHKDFRYWGLDRDLLQNIQN